MQWLRLSQTYSACLAMAMRLIAATNDALVSFEVEQDTYTAAEPRTGGTGRYHL